MLPESYFYSEAPEKFGKFFRKIKIKTIQKSNLKFRLEKFIMRYGTHVVVSAKFGGEFRIMHTMRKSKAMSIENFAEKCTQDSMKMFSRSWQVNVNLIVANLQKNESHQQSEANKKNSNSKKQDAES